ncbi:hypothetical protein ACLOJK_040423 [Asimina triloba]
MALEDPYTTRLGMIVANLKKVVAAEKALVQEEQELVEILWLDFPPNTWSEL